MHSSYQQGGAIRTCPSWNETQKGRFPSEWNSCQENSIISAKCEYEIMQILAKSEATLRYLDGQLDASRMVIYRQLKSMLADGFLTRRREGKVDIWGLADEVPE